MTTTEITNIHNNSKSAVWLFNVENPSKNAVIPAGQIHKAEFNVPWVDDGEQFLRHVLVVTSDKELIGYVWQHEKHLYFSKNGHQRANSDYHLPGHSGIGAAIELEVRGDGYLSGRRID